MSTTQTNQIPSAEEHNCSTCGARMFCPDADGKETTQEVPVGRLMEILAKTFGPQKREVVKPLPGIPGILTALFDQALEDAVSELHTKAEAAPAAAPTPAGLGEAATPEVVHLRALVDRLTAELNKRQEGTDKVMGLLDLFQLGMVQGELENTQGELQETQIELEESQIELEESQEDLEQALKSKSIAGLAIRIAGLSNNLNRNTSPEDLGQVAYLIRESALHIGRMVTE